MKHKASRAQKDPLILQRAESFRRAIAEEMVIPADAKDVRKFLKFLDEIDTLAATLRRLRNGPSIAAGILQLINAYPDRLQELGLPPDTDPPDGSLKLEDYFRQP